MRVLTLGTLLVPAVAGAAPTSQLDWATTFGSLLFVIVFILGLAWLLKRMQVPALVNQKGLSIVRQLSVGTKERVVIVQAGEEQYLVGVTSQSIQLIAKLDKPLAQDEVAVNSFASQFSQLIKKNESK
ncbi:flagellar biosynthetic protein FliO [Vibrio sp.]|uniref:flagellar biosynthetic protein FliO n=1 Tax=Vibrio sp. TaxID=678 RepID=UPI003D11229B